MNWRKRNLLLVINYESSWTLVTQVTNWVIKITLVFCTTRENKNKTFCFICYICVTSLIFLQALWCQSYKPDFLSSDTAQRPPYQNLAETWLQTSVESICLDTSLPTEYEFYPKQKIKENQGASYNSHLLPKQLQRAKQHHDMVGEVSQA